MHLNLGCGYDRDAFMLEGFDNIDVKGGGIDLGRFPWPWPDNSAEVIVASHILEHFTRTVGSMFLLECYRVLEPGGMLHLAVPDMDRFIDCRLHDDWAPVANYKWRDLNHLMGGDGTEPDTHNRHKYMYCFASLGYTLEQIGFDVYHRDGPNEYDNPRYEPISLYVDAVKPC